MRAEEVALYKEIQKNTEMALKAIDTISDKVYDDNMALQIARQSLKYSEMNNRAKDKLLQAKAQPYRSNYLSNIMLAGGIHSRTLLNTSTSRIAEMMIEGSNKGIMDMCKALNHNSGAGGYSVEMAKELMDFEEKNIERMKKYL